jgi:hypothetical protein
MIRPVTYYEPVCDRCGTSEADCEYSAWAEEGAAHGAAISNGWCEVDGELLCPECQACHVCTAPAWTVAIGPDEGDVPLCREHEHHYEAKELTPLRLRMDAITAAAEEIAARQRSMTPEGRAAEAAELELEKASMLAAADKFQASRQEPTDAQ